MDQKAVQSFKNEQSEHSTKRESTQFTLPHIINKSNVDPNTYSIFPFQSLGDDKIHNGFESFASWIEKEKTVIIEGYVGVFWERIQNEIHEILEKRGYSVNWVRALEYFKSSSEIKTITAPFLGTEDSVWGTKCTLELSDIIDNSRLGKVQPQKDSEINICIGPGAAFSNWDARIAYIDIPKNELQYRMRAGSIFNLGLNEIKESYKMYKHYYFVDWVLLNRHKRALKYSIEILVDGQWENTINWMLYKDLLMALKKISSSVIRTRPWFEPGPWGGQWIKKHIPDLNKNIVNYAWSFALITPENGILLESNSLLLEVSFDFLMLQQSENVLGKHHSRFGEQFPIRFNFLDTYDGGSLSVQCHPSKKYAKEVFGEDITQDETYYMLDCKKDAGVYLGFQEDIDSEEFRKALEYSQQFNKELDLEKYVQELTAKKHELFLIPNGTVHSAASGSMVLEISATPYIFTFKMYDWLRPDLNGKPRPINLDHAFKNLNFNYKGKRVEQELVSRPEIIAQGKDYEVVHLPTHEAHFYDIHRVDFQNTVSRNTNENFEVMMLVEGERIEVSTPNGTPQTLAYAETFVIPAAAMSYTLTNLGNSKAKVIIASIKETN